MVCHGVPKNQNCTCTCETHFENTIGLPTPILNTIAETHLLNQSWLWQHLWPEHLPPCVHPWSLLQSILTLVGQTASFIAAVGPKSTPLQIRASQLQVILQSDQSIMLLPQAQHLSFNSEMSLLGLQEPYSTKLEGGWLHLHQQLYGASRLSAPALIHIICIYTPSHSLSHLNAPYILDAHLSTACSWSTC